MKILFTAILSIAFLSLNAQTTYRAKISATSASVATVTSTAPSIVSVQTSTSTIQTGDEFLVTSPTLTVSISGNTLAVSGGTGGTKIWWVPFDNGQAPSAMTAIDVVECTGCPEGEPTTGDCANWEKDDKAYCGGCGGNCAWKSSGVINGSYLLVEASTLIYNGVSYQ